MLSNLSYAHPFFPMSFLSKIRLQQEMLRYLSSRQMHQENDVPEFQKKAMTCFRIMSRSFIDPGKTEENILIRDELKDADVWKNITTLHDQVLYVYKLVVLGYGYKSEIDHSISLEMIVGA
ncbi:hypothetical protein DCAR_0935874 [Daucus carota subsp. sativus]|uniref:Uncharacterized protein n=1 Tax=Daucus carota subsp. sativus TaxID=79200 RepID=A0A175YI26_DAUCS|nr:hypothetical protein DCAR_0935874 [Daucus carota subsp. sativus]